MFARYDLAHRGIAREDFDMASKGVVKVLEGRPGRRYPDMPSSHSPNTIACLTVNQRLTSSLPPGWSAAAAITSVHEQQSRNPTEHGFRAMRFTAVFFRQQLTLNAAGMHLNSEPSVESALRDKPGCSP